MTELLAAVLADSTNDLPRLVLADRLEERNQRGDTERAGLIRTQIELARQVESWRAGIPCDGTPLSSPVRSQLLRTERRLLSKWAGTWLGLEGWGWTTAPEQLPENAGRGQPIVVWSRGFPAEVRLTLTLCLGGTCRCRWLPVRKCILCAGDGVAPPLLPRLVRSHPITRVVLGNRAPYSVEHPAAPWWWDRGLDGQDLEHALPPAIFGRLPSPPFVRFAGGTDNRPSYGYDSEQDAIDAASTALITLAKASS